METDKTKKMSIMRKANYVETTLPHISNDRTVSQHELHGIVNVLNAHSLQMTRVLLISHKQGDFRRIKMAMTNCDIIPPPLRAVRKDHKTVGFDQQEVGPPSRPIVNGNGAPDTQCHELCHLYVRRQQILSTINMSAYLRKKC